MSNFLIFSLLGVIYDVYQSVSNDVKGESWSVIYASLGNVPLRIIQAYIGINTYWLSWLPSVWF